MPWTKADLRRSDTHLKRAWEMVARQENVIEEQKRAGKSTTEAERLLRLMRDGLQVLRGHRNMIERDLANE